jgi:MHS family proline/betaine transporter-like MFS transporter
VETTDFTNSVMEIERQSLESKVEEGHKEVSAKITAAAIRNPLQIIMAEHKLALCVGCFGIAGTGAFMYVMPLYGAQFIQRYDSLPPSAVTFSRMLGSLLQMMTVQAFGWLMDAWGVGKVHLLGLFVYAIVTPLPLLFWWTHVPEEHATAALFIGEILLSLLTGFTVVIYLWVVELFPVRVRATGMGIAYNIGLSIFGGLGPMIAEAGNRLIPPGGLISSPGLYTVAFGLVSISVVGGSRLLAKRGMIRLTHIRDSPY